MCLGRVPPCRGGPSRGSRAAGRRYTSAAARASATASWLPYSLPVNSVVDLTELDESGHRTSFITEGNASMSLRPLTIA